MAPGDGTRSILHERCFNHAQREAAAYCLECHHAFCKECVTEHEGRVVCSSCLRKVVTASSRTVGRARSLIFASCVVVGFFASWSLFYLLGKTLLLLPSSFHENALWQEGTE